MPKRVHKCTDYKTFSQKESSAFFDFSHHFSQTLAILNSKIPYTNCYVMCHLNCFCDKISVQQNQQQFRNSFEICRNTSIPLTFIVSYDIRCTPLTKVLREVMRHDFPWNIIKRWNARTCCLNALPEVLQNLQQGNKVFGFIILVVEYDVYFGLGVTSEYQALDHDFHKK